MGQKYFRFKLNFSHYFRFVIKLTFATMENQQSSDTDKEESLIQHAINVDLHDIKLLNDTPVDCCIKYSYKLIHPNNNTPEFSTKPFMIGCDKTWQEIPDSAYMQYTIPTTVKSNEIKNFFENNPFIIKIYNQEDLMGTATFDLSSLTNGKADEMWFGARYTKKEKILTRGHKDVVDIIGILKCNFVLEKENCTQCKSCNGIYKNSIIRKHVSQGKCQKGYSPEEMQILRDESKKRKKAKQAEQKRRTYDPEVRAKKHKETYDPIKRKASYNPELRAEGYKKSRPESCSPEVLEARKRDAEKDLATSNKERCLELIKSLDDEAKKMNSNSFEKVKHYFGKCKEAIVGMEIFIDEEISKNFEILFNRIEKKFEQLEIEIDIYADNAKKLKKVMDVSQLYKNFTIGSYHWKGGDKFLIIEEWKKVAGDIESIFTKMADHVEPITEYDGYGVIDNNRQKPSNKKCKEEHLCKKCLSKTSVTTE